ncbi:MAG: DUF488 domain-containing protein [Verrucomicrobia bacterium]|nr:DUF488 domain-containing protein [Verrucomicrobiota bacterium]
MTHPTFTPPVGNPASQAAAPAAEGLPKLVTLGAFGFTESGFFAALDRARVDTFCDVRYRRGVRGAEYAFVNRARLERRLAELGVRYLHFRDLAPGPALRACQAEADRAARIAKRQRTRLSEAFLAAYQRECLAGFESRGLLERMGPTARVVALFCVEREPAACHRSLLAARLQADLGIEVVHLLPP